MSGSICAKTGYPIASMNPTAQSWMPHQTLGTSSSACQTQTSPPDPETGHIQVKAHDSGHENFKFLFVQRLNRLIRLARDYHTSASCVKCAEKGGLRGLRRLSCGQKHQRQEAPYPGRQARPRAAYHWASGQYPGLRWQCLHSTLF